MNKELVLLLAILPFCLWAIHSFLTTRNIYPFHKKRYKSAVGPYVINHITDMVMYNGKSFTRPEFVQYVYSKVGVLDSPYEALSAYGEGFIEMGWAKVYLKKELAFYGENAPNFLHEGRIVFSKEIDGIAPSN